MKRVLVSQVQPSDILARPVISDLGSVLLYEGAVLNEENISKLKANGIEEVLISESDLDTGSYTLESVEQDSLRMVEEIIQKKLHSLNDEEGKSLSIIATKLVSDVSRDPRVASHLINVKRFRNDIYTHCLSVAAMSVIIGLKIGLSMSQLEDVAVGAILHDIGLGAVSIDYIDVEVNRLPATEKLKYRNHVIQGYERLQKEGWLSEMAKNIILLHHERLDGTGYPFHKPGERIPKEIRLVSICDYFDELANGIGYEKRKVCEVVEILRTIGTHSFDYDILMQVVTSIAWYPSGALVRTNENEMARVIRQNNGLPDRPILQIVLNADGTEPKEETIKDLLKCLTVFIEETIEE